MYLYRLRCPQISAPDRAFSSSLDGSYTDYLDEAGLFTRDEAALVHRPEEAMSWCQSRDDRVAYCAVHRDHEVQLLREFEGLNHEQIRQLLLRLLGLQP